jgi:serine/threonine protein phosphatase PrpC
MKVAVAAALASVCEIPYTSSANADPPSTTLVAAVVQDHTATIGWLGDSRAYWISPQGSRQLTKDDSWLNDIVASGQMTEAEASKSDKAHAITRWLGVDAIAFIFLGFTTRAFLCASHNLKVAKEDAFESIQDLRKVRSISYSANGDESRYLLDTAFASQHEQAFFI